VIPPCGVVLSTAVDDFCGLIYFESIAVFNILTSCVTICLPTSNRLISVSWSKSCQASPFSLKTLSFCYELSYDCLDLLGRGFVLDAIPVMSSSINYADIVFAGLALVSTMWYIFRGRKVFPDSPVPKDVVQDLQGVDIGENIIDNGMTAA
jgi:hypothetical protein